MMKKLVLIVVLVFFSLSVAAYAEKLDLSSWSDVNYPVQSQPDSSWTLSNANTTVTQAVNADPSMYLNNLNQTAYVMEGTWQVKTSGDNDFMGFVFGYQDETHFYIMDWKQLRQYSGGYGTAEEGFSIKKIAAVSKADLTAQDFWSSTDTGNMTILATNYGRGKGWADNTLYKFTLTFTNKGFSISVEDESGTTTLWDVSVSDTSYTFGQFGFYNFSQSNVEYNGFTQTGGEIVTPDDPSSGCTQAELDAKYNEGYNDGVATCEGCTQTQLDEKYDEGKQYCIDHPEECGIDTSGEYTQADIDTAGQEGYDEGYQVGLANCDSSSVTPDSNCATFNLFTNTLKVPCLDMGDVYWVDLELEGDHLTISGFGEVE